MSKTERVVLSDGDLDWIKLRKDISANQDEGMRERMLRKIKENPFVPIGNKHNQ